MGLGRGGGVERGLLVLAWLVVRASGKGERRVVEKALERSLGNLEERRSAVVLATRTRMRVTLRAGLMEVLVLFLVESELVAALALFCDNNRRSSF